MDRLQKYLAHSEFIVGPGETDLPEIWPEPLAVIVRALTENATFDRVFHNLPDIDLLNFGGAVA